MGSFDFENMFSAFKNSDYVKSKDKAYASAEIALRKTEFEENLNKMWSNYGHGMIAQLPEYNKQVNAIKEAGLKVFRNKDGKHRIVINENN